MLDTDLEISVVLTCSAPAVYPTPLICCFVLAYYTGERNTRLGQGTNLAEILNEEGWVAKILYD